MSVLRQPLKRPETYLTLLGILLVYLAFDTCRSPSSQLTGRLYVYGVRFYQAVGHPLLRGHIMCRYRPTCSEYSIEAVRRHGLRQGLVLTVHRIESCTTKVQPGTFDPVPIPESTSTVAHNRSKLRLESQISRECSPQPAAINGDGRGFTASIPTAASRELGRPLCRRRSAVGVRSGYDCLGRGHPEIPALLGITPVVADEQQAVLAAPVEHADAFQVLHLVAAAPRSSVPYRPGKPVIL